mmetsp:Transcript_20382/g.24749  ORF Transcript_20382/g.24749 Transcript_20382/m.24749 type:complete len:353 (-) Transcript_20382:1159-2217(-)
MKQAYTNTSKAKYAGKPLSLKGKSGVQMPMCRYGAACVYRSSCIYRHPKGKGKTVEKSEKVCTAFLAGICEFGNKCMDRHPGQQESDALRAKFAAKVCMYGETCRTDGCLYSHPLKYNSQDQHQSVQIQDEVSGITKGLENKTVLRATAKEWSPDSNFIIPSSLQENNLIPSSSSSTFSAARATVNSNPGIGGSGITKSFVTTQKHTQSSTPRKIKIPIELWLNEFERPMNAFDISDPEQRYSYVNQPYYAEGRAQALESLGVRVMDLHYQSKTTAVFVLDAHLHQELERSNKGCWIITGTGHHTAANSHQKKHVGGVLFQCVLNYLQEGGYYYRIGLDKQGKSGAFFVKKS